MTNQPPLSGIMLNSLRMIADNGGEIHAQGGGFWGYADGTRTGINTITVYALERRGLLIRMYMDSRYYRDGRVLTDAGEELTVKMNEEIAPA